MNELVTVRELPPSEIGRIAEIDRTEHISTGYTQHGATITAKLVDWHAPCWEGDDLAERIERCVDYLREGGVFIAAVGDDALAGFAILRPHLTPTMAQLAEFFVSRPYRRQGIGARLFEAVVHRAKASGAATLYVSAAPSESAVGFYLNQGCIPTAEPHPDLLALEPDDIHLTLEL